jgi:hypothetical protein
VELTFHIFFLQNIVHAAAAIVSEGEEEKEERQQRQQKGEEAGSFQDNQGQSREEDEDLRTLNQEYEAARKRGAELDRALSNLKHGAREERGHKEGGTEMERGGVGWGGGRLVPHSTAWEKISRLDGHLKFSPMPGMGGGGGAGEERHELSSQVIRGGSRRGGGGGGGGGAQGGGGGAGGVPGSTTADGAKVIPPTPPPTPAKD